MAANRTAIYPATEIRNTCPSCNSSIEPFIDIPDVPVNSCILMQSSEEARAYPRGEVVLGFCTDCGFICNLAFDARLAEYSGRYEETQGYSATFREFHRNLVLDLVERNDIRNKDVLEIGCGKGEFLALICELGGNRGLGFDPGYDEDRAILDNVPDARVIRDFYSQEYADHKADFVCCKMTLEHIPETAEFVRVARAAMKPDSLLYFLVPNATRILSDCAFEDIYYEHCSYFTAGSLSRLFRAEGLDVLRVDATYADQYLAIEARLPQSELPAIDDDGDLDTLRELVRSFPARYQEAIAFWRQLLTEAAKSGPIALWASGSKAVAFLGAVDTQGLIDLVVDINPNKHGHYMPSSGQPIIAPEDLGEHQPGTVIVMNGIYEPEVRADLQRMGLAPEIHTL